MTVTKTDAATIIEGDHIYLFAHMALVRALKLQVEHDFPPMRNMPKLKSLNKRFGLKARTYKEAYLALQAMIPLPEDVEGIAALAAMWKGDGKG
jgi:hypothetical protein